MDGQGYIKMDALLKWLNKDINHILDSEDVTWIIDTNDKVRFSMDDIKGVKADYGHSLKLPDMEMDEYRKNTKGHKRYIVHETYSKNVQTILQQGLSRMERNHIHLCQKIGGTWIRQKNEPISRYT